jgi:hypothetical protein
MRWMDPRVWTTAYGIAIATAQSPWWVGFVGFPGPCPPDPVHLVPDVEPDWTPIDGWEEEDLWYISGTTRYVSYLDVEREQTVAVRFAGDGQGATRVYHNWTPPDADGSGTVNSADISFFLTDWLGSVGTHGVNTGAGDFDLNLRVDSADIAAFLAAWLLEVGGG